MKQLVSKFSKAMTKELNENRHKSGWDDMSPRHCLRRAEQEMGELRRAVERGDPLDKIRSEAADVGNFLAMLIWNLDREIRDAKKNKVTTLSRQRQLRAGSNRGEDHKLNLHHDKSRGGESFHGP